MTDVALLVATANRDGREIPNSDSDSLESKDDGQRSSLDILHNKMGFVLVLDKYKNERLSESD